MMMLIPPHQANQQYIVEKSGGVSNSVKEVSSTVADGSDLTGGLNIATFLNTLNLGGVLNSLDLSGLSLGGFTSGLTTGSTKGSSGGSTGGNNGG